MCIVAKSLKSSYIIASNLSLEQVTSLYKIIKENICNKPHKFTYQIETDFFPSPSFNLPENVV